MFRAYEAIMNCFYPWSQVPAGGVCCAFWGSPDQKKWSDVTDLLQAQVEACGTFELAPDVNILGDPAEGHRKELVVFAVAAATADLENASRGAAAATVRTVVVKGSLFGIFAASMGLPIGVAVIASPVGWAVTGTTVALAGWCHSLRSRGQQVPACAVMGQVESAIDVDPHTRFTPCADNTLLVTEPAVVGVTDGIIGASAAHVSSAETFAHLHASCGHNMDLVFKALDKSLKAVQRVHPFTNGTELQKVLVHANMICDHLFMAEASAGAALAVDASFAVAEGGVGVAAVSSDGAMALEGTTVLEGLAATEGSAAAGEVATVAVAPTALASTMTSETAVSALLTTAPAVTAGEAALALAPVVTTVGEAIATTAIVGEAAAAVGEATAT